VTFLAGWKRLEKGLESALTPGSNRRILPASQAQRTT